MEIILFGQSPVTGLSEAERSYANWLYQSQSIKLYPHLKGMEFIEVCLDFCNWNTAWKVNWMKYPHNLMVAIKGGHRQQSFKNKSIQPRPYVSVPSLQWQYSSGVKLSTYINIGANRSWSQQCTARSLQQQHLSTQGAHSVLWHGMQKFPENPYHLTLRDNLWGFIDSKYKVHPCTETSTTWAQVEQHFNIGNLTLGW